MIRWPGQVKPVDRPELAISLDLAPTILAGYGLAPTKKMQGIDLLNDEALRQRDTIHGACYLHKVVDTHNPAANLTWRWIINDKWKLVLPYRKNVTTRAKERGSGEVRLYDLSVDPFEKNNLAGAESCQVERLGKKLNDLLPGT